MTREKEHQAQILFDKSEGEIIHKSDVITKLFKDGRIRSIQLRFTLTDNHTYDFDFHVDDL